MSWSLFISCDPVAFSIKSFQDKMQRKPGCQNIDFFLYNPEKVILERCLPQTRRYSTDFEHKEFIYIYRISTKDSGCFVFLFFDFQ